MIVNAMRTLLAALLLLCAVCDAKAAAGTPDCDKNADACIRWAIVEVATYVEVCGRLLPDLRPMLDAAYAKWSVLKLPIPGLNAALEPGSPERVALSKKIGPYMQARMSYEREIECFSRFSLLRSKPPRLEADYVLLPRNALAPYLK
jgi:hypothetical protein